MKWIAAFAGFLVAFQAFAFNPPVDTAGPLKVSIAGPQVVEGRDAPVSIQLRIENTGTESAQGTIRVRVIDDWRVTPDTPMDFSVQQSGSVTVDFSVSLAERTYNAHYPIHATAEFASGGRHYTAHPILIVETRLPSPPVAASTVEWRPFEVSPNSTLGLWFLPVYRALVCVDGRETEVMPVGWQGSHGQTRANVRFGDIVDRGGLRETIAMHPAWYAGQNGPVLVEFPLLLPRTKPIRLSFANAIRDSFPERGEPASDGVTFRVRAAPIDAKAGELGRILFERHTASKVWDPAEADLSEFAGQGIRLQLESHPGPKNDTTCDASYWGEPTLIAGEQTSLAPCPGPGHKLGAVGQEGKQYEVYVVSGHRGLLDAEVGFQRGDKSVLRFAGFRVRVLGYALSDYRSPCTPIDIKEEATDNRLRVRHRFRAVEGEFDLVGELRIEKGALLAQFSLDNGPRPMPWRVARIEDVATGSWSAHANRVYAGVGNVLVDPKAFTLYFDGHQLSTSFVGFDFASGVSLVQAVDATPDRLAVEPDARFQYYSLHTPHNQTMALIPAENVWDAVKVWRAIDPRKASDGVPALAGKFVFDLWGGRYADSAEALRRAFQYGLTDSVVMWHAWQRWGYDYRLPDIFPPNPYLGSHDDFRGLVKTCKDAGVLFGPHDNYIDFYPDAEEFSYDHVSFNGDGTPQAGWLNAGQGAQAYRFRPDQVRPFIERNLRLIREDFAPTAYFIDVWSSAGPHDFWTKDGQFFDRGVTRKAWGEGFAWIRDFLGGHAPQISESGHDQLIGWLDGAQCNHLRWGDPASGPHGPTYWAIDAADGERIPWIDAAYHDRFVLHGAGYEPRYCSGLDPRLHGIYSDDYLATEVLTGHPAMVDAPFGRDVVRVYWLLHDLMKGLALRRIESVEFVGGDIHRQHVRWEGGAETWINRGKGDWSVGDRVLPQYGFYACAPGERQVEAAIERRDGVIVDWSRSEQTLLANARPAPDSLAPIGVESNTLSFRTPPELSLRLRWKAERPLTEPMRVFVHFVDEAGKILFQADFDPDLPTTQWQGIVENGTQARIPEEYGAGRSFEVRVGLYEAQTVRRVEIDGISDGQGGVRLGKVKLLGDGNALTGIEWTPVEDPAGETLRRRLNVEKKLIAFGPLTTNGACRVSREGNALVLTPLPDSQEFTLRIAWEDLPWKLPRPTNIEMLSGVGSPTGRLPVEQAGQWSGKELVLKCRSGVFGYRLTSGEPATGR